MVNITRSVVLASAVVAAALVVAVHVPRIHPLPPRWRSASR
jgi:hypothetical protein